MDTEQIARLEWANYASTLPIAQMTPGLQIALREDVILTSSEIFPAVDTTHACLLRAAPETAEALLDEVTNYFESRNLPTRIFISPACAPGDLPERLLQRGFVKQKIAESWLTADLLNTPVPAPLATDKISIRKIDKSGALDFATIFLTAHQLPVEFAPFVAQLLEPALDTPDMNMYLAFIDEKPVATTAVRYYQNFGIYGSGAVLPEHRGSSAISNLFIRGAEEARQRGGIDTMFLQTTAGAPLERLLRIWGFKTAFTRTGYTWHEATG